MTTFQSTINTFLGYPISTAVSLETLKNATFPSVTLCALNPLKQRVLQVFLLSLQGVVNLPRVSERLPRYLQHVANIRDFAHEWIQPFGIGCEKQ